MNYHPEAKEDNDDKFKTYTPKDLSSYVIYILFNTLVLTSVFNIQQIYYRWFMHYKTHVAKPFLQLHSSDILLYFSNKFIVSHLDAIFVIKVHTGCNMIL